MSALDHQEGGSHYKNLSIQPVHFIYANDIPYIEGNIIKYVCRHKWKGGKEDLLKAIHYLHVLIMVEYEQNDEEIPKKRKRDK